MRRQHEQSIAPVLAGVFVVLLGLRIFVGVDLTDEIQYYYQMLGLVESNSFFSNDLYVQQLIYLPFYPVLKLYFIFMGDAGLIIFGRSLFAGCLLLLYFFSNKVLSRAGISPLVSTMSAFALCFAPAFHGIFAISYNTISQIGWCLVVLIVAFRLPVSSLLWALIICVTGLAHPLSGVAIAGVCVCVHLLDREVYKLTRILIWVVLVTVSVSAIVVWLSGGAEALHRSLTFSAGFSVGSSFGQASTLRVAGVVVLLLVCAAFFPAVKWAGVPLLMFAGFLGAFFDVMLLKNHIEVASVGRWGSSYSTGQLKVWLILSVACIYTARCLCVDVPAINAIARRLVCIGVIHFLVLSGTSSNGVNQGIGAFAVLLPIAAALPELGQLYIAKRAVSAFPVITVTIWVLILTVCFPYRQAPLYSMDRSLTNISLFRGLLVSGSLLAFSDEVRKELSHLIPEESGFIISTVPGLYPILGVSPRTCMIYNHSLGSIRAQTALRECLSEREIKFVANLHGNKTDLREAEKLSFQFALANARSFKCRVYQLQLPLAPLGYFTNPVLTMCN